MKRAFSFGGGRQSTAALVLKARGELDVDCFVFANVGADSENPNTLAYIRDYSRPYAEAHGIELVEVQRKFRDGRNPSLYQHLLRQRGADWVIPFRVDGRPANRKCTSDWKIRVIGRHLRDLGWRPPYELHLGISWDEADRMRDPEIPDREYGYLRRYPLIERRLTAADCTRLVVEAGLPPPPKSACWFCPFTDRRGWAAMRFSRPDLFWRAANLESRLNDRRRRLGKDEVYLSDRMKPLYVAIPEGAEQIGLFDGDGGACTSGVCWT